MKSRIVIRLVWLVWFSVENYTKLNDGLKQKEFFKKYIIWIALRREIWIKFLKTDPL